MRHDYTEIDGSLEIDDIIRHAKKLGKKEMTWSPEGWERLTAFCGEWSKSFNVHNGFMFMGVRHYKAGMPHYAGK